MNIIAPAAAPVLREGNGVGMILGLFVLRWLAGILENFGVPALSQAAALIMLAGLAVTLLHRMQIAPHAGMFLLGLGAWVVSGLFSFAANPDIELRSTVALLSLLSLYAVFANACLIYLRGEAALAALSRILGLFVLVGCALSLWQIGSGTGFVEHGKSSIQRAFGSDVHPVSFAIQIVAALTGVEIIRSRLRRRPSTGYVLVLLAGTVALYLTFARTAWVIALITLAGLFLLHGPFARRLTLGLTGSLGAVILLMSSERFADLSSLPVFFASYSFQDMVFDWRYIDNSLSWRIVNWSYGLSQALEQPVFGFGPGQSANSSRFALEMHNIFLEALFEGGVFGLLALVMTLAGLARLHRRLPSATGPDRRARTLANAFAAALFLGVTFSTSFVDQLMSFLLYLLVLAAAAAPIPDDRDENLRPPVRNV